MLFKIFDVLLLLTLSIQEHENPIKANGSNAGALTAVAPSHALASVVT